MARRLPKFPFLLVLTRLQRVVVCFESFGYLGAGREPNAFAALHVVDKALQQDQMAGPSADLG